MTDTSGSSEPIGNLQKDPEDWKTGDDPPTEAQLSFAHTIYDSIKDTVGEIDWGGFTKASLSEWIDEHKP